MSERSGNGGHGGETGGPAPDDPVLGRLIREEATYHAAPAALRRSLAAALREEPAPRRAIRQPWFGWGLAFACGVIATWLAGVIVPGSLAGDGADAELVSAHVRAMQPGHATDVLSSDQHTVKPWLSARLDFSLPVRDLAEAGFPLVGGRLDYVDGRTVAAMVYQRHRHVIDVFAWPARGNSLAIPRPVARNGFNIVTWENGGIRYRAIGDVPVEELEQLAALLKG